jgi:Carboxypeptidase regulatory-like domain
MPDDQRCVTADQDIYSALLSPEITILTMCQDTMFLGDTGCQFAGPWWPSASGLIDVGALDDAWGVQPYSWGIYYPVSGANGRFAISGVTRDLSGAPLSGVAVKLFRSTDDSLQASVVSDANGYYLATTPYADGHYLVTYKAGPPDVYGTTANTLTPS